MNQEIADWLARYAQPADSEAQDGSFEASVGSCAEKPCYRDEVAGRARLPGTFASTSPDEATFASQPQVGTADLF